MQELKEQITLTGHIMITDPCYEPDTWCQYDTFVLSGTYHCFFKSFINGRYQRIAEIEIKHEQYLQEESTELLPRQIGVDGGSCGIFDYDYYIQNHNRDKWQNRLYNTTCNEADNPNFIQYTETPFYKNHEKMREQNQNGELSDEDYVKHLFSFQQECIEYVQNLDLSVEFIPKLRAETVDGKCLVSSSGYGDGLYPLYCARNKYGEIVGLKLIFIFEDEMEE